MAAMRHIAVFGCGHDGRLGTGGLGDVNVNIPSVLTYFEDERKHVGDIISVHVGGYHTLVRTTEGVYGFGSNDEGQMGTGEKTQFYKTPTKIDFFEDGSKVLQIECGSLHTVVVMRSGLYACGSNTYGQLGLGDNESRNSFTKLESPFFSSVEADGLPYDTLVSHVSCGTFHTLVALKNSLLPVDLVHPAPLDTFSSPSYTESKVQELVFYPCIVLACGKGDYGELGYDASPWDLMASREQRLKNVIKSRAHDMSQGAAQDDTLAAAQSSAMYDGAPMKKPFQFKKPQKVRRGEFYHSHLKNCQFPLLEEHAKNLNDLATTDVDGKQQQKIWIAGLRASHLHSSVVIAFDNSDGALPPRYDTFHFGCYYCGGVEGNESSIPRTIEDLFSDASPVSSPFNSAVDVHGGDEVLIVCSTTANGGYIGGGAAPLQTLYVLGKGNIGTNDDDAYEPKFVPVLLPSTTSSTISAGPEAVGSVSVSGRSLFLVWKHSFQDRNEVDELFSFGDSVFGQCGVMPSTTADDSDAVLVPTLIMKSGDTISLAPRGKQRKRTDESGQSTVASTNSTEGITLTRVVDVQCGAKHSVVLFEGSLNVSAGGPSL